MHQKLLRNVVFLGIAIMTLGVIISGCISDPSIPPIQPMMTKLRFVNAVTTGSAIDIYLDGQKIVSSKPYKTATSYMDIGSGDYNLLVTVAGNVKDSVFNQKITLASLTQQTILIFDKASKPDPTYKYIPAPMLQTMERYTYSDEAKALADSNLTAVKLINVCTGNAPTLLHLDSKTGTIIISGPLDNVGKPSTDGIAFGEPSPYSAPPIAKLLPGTYNFFPMANNLEVLPSPFYIQARVDKGVRYTFVLLGTSANAEYLVLTDDK